jgi:pyridoxal phosphate enzyme (YggS family)
VDTALTARLEAVRERIRRACARSGRPPDEVSLLPVSKTVDPERIREAVAAGLTVFGESRVQEARQKIPLCPGHLAWHFVGHLQTNKVREAVRLFAMIHAVDSTRLLETVDAACRAAGRVLPVLLEVNVSGEGSKFGLAPEAVPEALRAARGLFGVEVLGLMTIPPLAEDTEHARPHFRRLRELRDRCRSETGVALPELSMGMSHDFEIAVEEGATWVRLGTALFGERKVTPRDES